MIAKDFQEATANRIVELFRQGHNRVLLADEVGLGKTIVAKTVVEKTGIWRKEVEKDEYEYVVVYICSNAGIAEQNCSKLGISKENRVSISEGRLSMQHLMLAESKSNGNVRLIPMTPATSFQMRAGAGTAPERALAFLLLDMCRMCGGYHQELSLLLRTRFIESPDSWEGYVSNQRWRINSLDNRKQYLSDMKTLLEQHLKPELISEIKSVCRRIKKNRDKSSYKADLENIIPWQKQKDIINQLRYCFAQISLGMLNPDLVIMDEFQRFRDLIEIDDKDYSDSALLSKKFLKDNTNSCVLLLSATPYKPYSTLSELTDGEETHMQGFMRVMDFLMNEKKENEEFHSVWESYSEHLSEIQGQNLSVLISSKKEAESALYKHMCRTERRNSAIINTEKAKFIPIDKLSAANVNSFIELQRAFRDMGYGNFPIEYIKSAPFLMSFMNYKVKDDIDDFLTGKKVEITPEERNKYIKCMPTAFLKRSHINSYHPLPDTNARLNVLFDEIFGANGIKKGNPELLLWIPPANKYYNAGSKSVFEQCEGYSKTLVFSSWEMVPRALSTLVSYESERLVNKKIANKIDEQKSYYAVPEETDFIDTENPKTTKRGKTRYLIREQRELVAYPSIWLAQKYDCSKYFGYEIDDLKKEIKQQIKEDLLRLENNTNISKSNLGARQILLFLKYMDGIVPSPERIPSDETIDILVNMAIGSPAVCLFRIQDKI